MKKKLDHLLEKWARDLSTLDISVRNYTMGSFMGIKWNAVAWNPPLSIWETVTSQKGPKMQEIEIYIFG